jgi:glycosyltransferase involved in cell wall biosynthesis
MSLSVIVSSYNRPHSLRRAIESALEQETVDQVIVVDDASSSPPDLSDLDMGRIRLECHRVNRGICAVRNTGLSLARTQYIAFLDDDDRLLPAAYQPLLDELQGLSAVVIGIVIAERNGKTSRVHLPPSSRAGQIWGLDEFLLEDRQRSFNCKQSAVYPIQLLRDLGGWNEKIRSHSQLELFFRICAQYDVIGVDHPVYSLSRGASDHLTQDRSLRQTSHRYLLTNYGELLADSQRLAYFERTHRANLRRTSRWYRAARRMAGLLRS